METIRLKVETVQQDVIEIEIDSFPVYRKDIAHYFKIIDQKNMITVMLGNPTYIQLSHDIDIAYDSDSYESTAEEFENCLLKVTKKLGI